MSGRCDCGSRGCCGGRGSAGSGDACVYGHCGCGSRGGCGGRGSAGNGDACVYGHCVGDYCRCEPGRAPAVARREHDIRKADQSLLHAHNRIRMLSHLPDASESEKRDARRALVAAREELRRAREPPSSGEPRWADYPTVSVKDYERTPYHTQHRIQ